MLLPQNSHSGLQQQQQKVFPLISYALLARELVNAPNRTADRVSQKERKRSKLGH
jgi:hypothetical protein